VKNVANVLWKIGSASLTKSVSYFAVNLTDVSTLTTDAVYGIISLVYVNGTESV